VKRNARPCAIAMMDLDRFKSINDTYGHSVGDRVLTGSARYVMTHLRPYDKIFRYGGEEFLICLPDTDLQTGLDLIDRLRSELAALLHEVDGRPPLHATVSFGLAALDPDIRVEAAIDRADKALYAAKAAGRNRALAWAPSMGEPPDRKRAAETV
jgi:diguanylate cyclase